MAILGDFCIPVFEHWQITTHFNPCEQ